MHEKRTTPLYDDNKRTTRIPEFDLEGYKRSRILALFLMGFLLIGAAWMWVNMQRQKAEEAPVLSRATPATPETPATPLTPPAPVAVAPAAGPAGTAQPTPAPIIAPPAATVTAPAPQASATSQMAQMTGAVAMPVPEVPPPATGRKNLAATPRVLATSEARLQAGRVDPTLRLHNFQPFPRFAGVSPVAEGVDVGQLPPPLPIAEKVLPPPPPPASADGLVPPPSPDAGLSLAELPAPPSRPSIGNKMKLVGVVGDKAIIAFTDRRARMENKWPKTITLGKGEQFESVSVIDVTPDSVTFDEDGERSVKSVEPLR